jgi:hypothetical protein
MSGWVRLFGLCHVISDYVRIVHVEKGYLMLFQVVSC